MKAIVVSCVMGVLGFGEDGTLIEKILFPKNVLKIVEKLVEVESGKSISEVIDLAEKLRKKGYATFVFENAGLAQAVREEIGAEVEVGTPSEISEKLLGNMGKLAVESGFFKDPSEMTKLIHDVSMELSRMKVKKATEKRDLLIVQAIQAVDDLDKTLNLLMSRIREWYGLHFPELDRLIDNHETYARLLNYLGKRENFTAENLEQKGLTKNKSLQVAETAKRSMGADLFDVDIEQIQMLCGLVLNLYDVRSKLEKYVDEMMGEVALNTRTLTGATLGARLIAIAGGLTNLARMPASTIQVLGAEKALFRSLTTGARPPKHGIIFQHTLIHDAKRWQRGKIARAFAGKLAIAIRADAFGSNYIGDGLKEGLQKRIEEINIKYTQPRQQEIKPFKKAQRPFRKPRRFMRRK